MNVRNMLCKFKKRVAKEGFKTKGWEEKKTTKWGCLKTKGWEGRKERVRTIKNLGLERKES